MKLKYNVLLIFSFALCSCSRINTIFWDYSNNRIMKALPSAQNAIDFLVERLATQKIIILGEQHAYVTEELFLAKNIKKLYDAGVRYFAFEGGTVLENAVPGSKGYSFIMFYPWMNGGWRYEEILFYQALLEFNSTLPEEDQIKFIIPQTISNNLNDRDSSSFENITRIMNNVGENIKTIAFFGNAHAGTKIMKNYTGGMGERYDWITLGYRLKQYYGKSFSSYNFWLLPENDLLLEPKFLTDEKVNGIFGSFYDGFIFDKEITGTFYQYNPTDENIEFIISLVYDYALNQQGETIDEPFLFFDPKGQFMMGIYYLKLYYGDNFNFDFWRDRTTHDLLQSLDELKLWILAEDYPSQRLTVDFEYDKILLYHHYIYNSGIENVAGYFNEAIDVNIDYLVKAHELFPEDIWSLYWLGFISADKGEYTTAISYFQTLFGSDLASCLEQLPYAYQKAAYCASMINDNGLKQEYTYMANALTNEFNLNVYNNVYFHR